MKHATVAVALVAVSLGLGALPPVASAMTGPPAQAQTSLKTAKMAIDAGQFTEAVTELKAALDKERDNADLWNLLGFSYRKMGDFDLAWDAYERALTLNPNHRGANEYLGELYLQQGQIDLARGQLEKLKQICPFGCRERAELEERIQDAAEG